MNDNGLLIKQLRIQKGLTQKELLEGQFSTTYLSRIENESIKPSRAFIEFIAKRFKIAEGDLSFVKPLDEKKVLEIYKVFKESGVISGRDMSLLKIYAGQPFSSVIYLCLYSVLIRYDIKSCFYKEAEKMLDQSTRFLPDIETMIGLNNDTVVSYYLISCGNLYYLKQNFFKADQYYTEAAKLNLDKEDEADLFYNMSITKQQILRDKNVSLYYSKKAHEIYTKQKLRYKQYRTLITIAVQNVLMENYDEALEQLNEVKRYMNDIQDVEMLSIVEYNLGNIQQRKKNYKQALEHYHQKLGYLNSIDSEKGKFYVYRNMTLLYLELRNFPSVDKYLDKAFEAVEQSTQAYSYNEILSIQAKVLKQKGEEKRYQRLMEKAIDNCVENNLHTLKKELSAELGTHYYQNGSYKKSSQYLLNLQD